MDKKDAVVSALKTVVDPHTGMNVYDMGLISDIDVSADGVTMTFMPSGRGAGQVDP
jgi:metal-sulfur cluster biosynthetic enzyme